MVVLMSGLFRSAPAVCQAKPEPFSCARPSHWVIGFQQTLELDSIHAAAFFGDPYHTPGISAVAWRFRGKRPSFPAPLGPSKPPADLEGQSLRGNVCPPAKRFLVMVITSFRQRPRYAAPSL